LIAGSECGAKLPVLSYQGQRQRQDARIDLPDQDQIIDQNLGWPLKQLEVIIFAHFDNRTAHNDFIHGDAEIDAATIIDEVLKAFGRCRI
jgi:hypothetical protein